MLLNYKINNYKYINKEIELDLKTNIFFICGKGNCGKTSILDSIIFAISHIISPAQYILKEQISFYKNFISNFEKDDKRCLFEITIEMNNILYKYGLELNKDELNNINVDKEWLEVDGKIVFKRNGKEIQESNMLKECEIEKYIDDSIPLISTLIISKKNEKINKLYEYLKSIVIIDSSLNSLIINDNVIKKLNKEKKLVLKVLNKINKNYQDFIAKEKNIISIYKDGNEVNFMNESSSIQNILLYVPRIIDAIKNESIIIIDDIDKRFSKKLVNIIEELLLDKTINKNNTQLIATVSNREYIGESEKVLWI